MTARRKSAEIVLLNQAEVGRNWRALLGDALRRKNVRGVALTVFYRDGTNRVGLVWYQAQQSGSSGCPAPPRQRAGADE